MRNTPQTKRKRTKEQNLDFSRYLSSSKEVPTTLNPAVSLQGKHMSSNRNAKLSVITKLNDVTKRRRQDSSSLHD